LKKPPLFIFTFLCILFSQQGLFASEQNHPEKEEEFNASEYILEHIGDSHEFHIVTVKGHHYSVPLPVILYSKHSGFHVFMSSKLTHGHLYKNFELTKEGANKGKIVEHVGHELVKPFDFSITKNVFTMLLSAVFLLWIFISLARSYKKVGISEPRGKQGFFEPLILFVRDDIAIVNIGKEKYEKYMPYLLTVFFFIWINNLIGLIPFFPFGANVTGNIAVTLVLAMFTFVITQLNANKTYWNHIFAMPGIPVWLYPVMIPIELIGLLSKPFALMIRLFANISAGHIIVLALISLIFIFKTILVAPASIIFVLFIDIIELFVAALQAYVFTLLSSLFIGMAVQEGGH